MVNALRTERNRNQQKSGTLLLMTFEVELGHCTCNINKRLRRLCEADSEKNDFRKSICEADSGKNDFHKSLCEADSEKSDFRKRLVKLIQKKMIFVKVLICFWCIAHSRNEGVV